MTGNLLFLTKRRPIPLPAALLLAAVGSLLPSAARCDDSKELPLRIIVVPTQEAADAIVHQLQGGADFARLAKEKSVHQTAEDGGYLGVIRPSFLRDELRKGLSGVAPGSFTGVIKLPDGYAILQVLKQPPPSAPDARPAAGILPLAAQGAVKYTTDVGGYAEALLTRRAHFSNDPAAWQDLHAACQVRLDSVPGSIANVRDMLKDDTAPTEKRLHILYTIAQLYASEGNMDEAIRYWRQEWDLAVLNHHPIIPTLRMVLATAYLHRASIDERSTKDGVDPSRIFPSMPGALHPRQADVKEAISLFTDALKDDPDNLEAKWLLNEAYMTNGTYPDKVPPQFLISPAKLASKEDVGHFADIAPSAGVNIATTAGGIIVDDFDNDGLLDIVVSQIDDCAPLRFFHNNGDGTFSDRTEAAGLSNQFGGLNIRQADYNNDGCVDILVLRGGWEFPRRLSLLKNNCNGTFSDVTLQSGLGKAPTATQTAAWTDIDNDGNLDLFIGNENGSSQLFLNKGDGTFVDIAHEAGVDATAMSKGVVAEDYDGDGLPDIFVSNFGGNNFLYHNNGNRTFTDVAKQAHVQEPWRSFAAAFLDYNNDGLPDIFVTSYYTSLDEFARDALGMPRNGETMKLFRNRGDGTFEDVAASVGIDRVMMPMGFNFGDIDNDGFLDLYFGGGNPSYVARVPNKLFHNKGGKAFIDVTTSSGTGAVEKGHAIAFADFTNSGREDIAIVMGGAVPGDSHSLRLFQNPGTDNDWLTVHLVGVKTNRSAIGAKIKVTVRNGSEPARSIYRTVDSGASFGASPLEQHIGLGKSAKIERVEIFWPTSHTTQTFSAVKPDQAIEIKEFATDYRTLVRKKFQFNHEPAAALNAKTR